MVLPLSNLNSVQPVPSANAATVQSLYLPAVRELSTFLSGPLDSQLALSTAFNPTGSNSTFFQMLSNIMMPFKTQAAGAFAMLQNAPASSLSGGAIMASNNITNTGINSVLSGGLPLTTGTNLLGTAALPQTAAPVAGNASSGIDLTTLATTVSTLVKQLVAAPAPAAKAADAISKNQTETTKVSGDTKTVAGNAGNAQGQSTQKSDSQNKGGNTTTQDAAAKKDTKAQDAGTKDGTQNKDNTQTTKDSGNKNTGKTDQATKDTSNKDQAAKDAGNKEQTAKDSGKTDQAAKDQATKDSSKTDQADSDHHHHDQASSDTASKDQVAKDTGNKDQATKESGGKNADKTEQAAKDTSSKDQSNTDHHHH